jgi:hypothetical protein
VRKSLSQAKIDAALAVADNWIGLPFVHHSVSNRWYSVGDGVFIKYQDGQWWHCHPRLDGTMRVCNLKFCEERSSPKLSVPDPELEPTPSGGDHV